MHNYLARAGSLIHFSLPSQKTIDTKASISPYPAENCVGLVLSVCYIALF